MTREPGFSSLAPQFRQRDLSFAGGEDPRGGVAKAFATVFAPAASSFCNVQDAEFLFAPFGGPARFASGAGAVFGGEKQFPGKPARITEAHPDEVEAFVTEDALVFRGIGKKGGVQDDKTLANKRSRVGRVARRVAEV